MVHFPGHLNGKTCPSLPEFTLETLMCAGEKYSIVVQDLVSEDQISSLNKMQEKGLTLFQKWNDLSHQNSEKCAVNMWTADLCAIK